MRKEIYWYHNEEKYIGYAELEDGILALRHNYGEAFDLIEQDEISNGATLKEIFDDIPEDVTDFRLI